MGYVHKEIASPFITVQKDEGIHPAAKPLHFLFTLSQSLFQHNTMPTSSTIQYSHPVPYSTHIQYNTILSTITMEPPQAL